MLADFLGTDLHKIANELKKLTIALPKNKSIDDADVERNIGISKDYNVFELQNAIGSRDVLKANRIVNYFGDNGKDNPLLVTAITLYGYFTKILKLHFAADKSQGALASVLGVNPYFVKDYQLAARNYPPGASRDREDAWEEIKANEDVSLTFDLYSIGMVFFREGIEKQDFVLKY